MSWPGLEPATRRSLVQRPNYYTTKPSSSSSYSSLIVITEASSRTSVQWWLDQIREDKLRPAVDVCRDPVRRGHPGATLRVPTDYASEYATTTTTTYSNNTLFHTLVTFLEVWMRTVAECWLVDRRANGQCRYRHVTPTEFEKEQLCAMAEMPEASLRTSNTVYRKRKAPSSVDNDDADDDEDEERCLNNTDCAAVFTSGKQAVYLAPAYNNFRLGYRTTLDESRLVGSDAMHLLGGNNFQMMAAQPSTAVLPVAILPSVPLGVMATPGICDVIRMCDRSTPVAAAAVAVGTNVIYPVTQWLWKLRSILY